VDLGVDPATVGVAGARTEVVETAPRPPRTDRVLVSDDGEAGRRLAAWLVERELVRTTPATGEVL
jgi:electron transfer flavoprotein beta subunit